MSKAKSFVRLALYTVDSISNDVRKEMIKEVSTDEFVTRMTKMIRKKLNEDGHFSSSTISVIKKSSGVEYKIHFWAKDESEIVMTINTGASISGS